METPIGLLHSKKLAAAVLLYVFMIAFPAPLLGKYFFMILNKKYIYIFEVRYDIYICISQISEFWKVDVLSTRR